ncbi:ParB-like nuclease domain-containing protein [Desulfatibacillum alkenivorans DSM 16219]|uniref:ParB-like nuclease domain-containing protein n=1 Tax=Desulfatibacillum alkenivorans DSM 16219 TaxID=1121393 RepID=A0A1M6NB06_9BACT|nr:ParB N-terminal domain-containing protein [Desulfatibacillum alkenivorans]SHJ92888.1 ParB-like nuclease domain-containing protein [Desulfatibacillum alkenivorans DSM 16219]
MNLEILCMDQLRPFEKNPRINDHAVDAVARSIKSFGFNNPIIIGPDNRICAGHTRWKAAQKLGMKDVPVVRVDSLIAEKFIAYNIADNKTASLAYWDDSLLAEILNDLKSLNFDLGDVGFTESELTKLLSEQQEGFDKADLVDPSKLPAKTMHGDIFSLGNSKICCGDSRNLDSIKLLLDGVNVDAQVKS